MIGSRGKLSSKNSGSVKPKAVAQKEQRCLRSLFRPVSGSAIRTWYVTLYYKDPEALCLAYKSLAIGFVKNLKSTHILTESLQNDNLSLFGLIEILLYVKPAKKSYIYIYTGWHRSGAQPKHTS